MGPACEARRRTDPKGLRVHSRWPPIRLRIFFFFFLSMLQQRILDGKAYTSYLTMIECSIPEFTIELEWSFLTLLDLEDDTINSSH